MPTVLIGDIQVFYERTGAGQPILRLLAERGGVPA